MAIVFIHLQWFLYGKDWVGAFIDVEASDDEYMRIFYNSIFPHKKINWCLTDINRCLTDISQF